jgi:ATP-binding cassette subfamily B protein
MFAMVSVQLYMPTLLASFIDNLPSITRNNDIMRYSLLSGLCILLYASFNASRFYLFDRVGNEIITDLRKRLFSSLIRQEISFFDNKKVGEFTSRLSSDVEMIKDIVTVDMAMALRSLLTSIGGVAMLLTLSFKLTLLLILLTPISFILAKWLGKKARVYAGDIQDNLAENIQCAQEYLTNVRVVYNNNVERRSIRHFDSSVGKTLKSYNKNASLFALYQWSSTLVSMFSVLALIILGSTFVVEKAMSLGELSSFIIYATMVSGSFAGLSHFWGEWMRTVGATDDLFALIQRVSQSPKEQSKEKKLKVTPQDIIFDDVNFSYPSRPEHSVFEHFSLQIDVGKKTALVGRSGSGKSTIVNLILGCYPLNSGQIKLGHNSLSDYGYESVVDSVSVVEQEPVIFSGTISDNISFASKKENVSDVDIQQAAKKAHIHDFIVGLPDGYKTVVGERGAQLSGGQKQRIAIARAFLRDTDIIILDEPTSALDSENAALIRAAFNELAQNKTTIIIAHSLSQIIDADKIVVLDKGKVVAEGEHRQLMQSQQSVYTELFAAELSMPLK